MKATKNVRKSIISGLLTLVMAASMFLGMGKVEVQAANFSDQNLKEGTVLKPGDVILASDFSGAVIWVYGTGESLGSSDYADLRVVDSYNGMPISELLITDTWIDYMGDGYISITVEVYSNGKLVAPSNAEEVPTTETASNIHVDSVGSNVTIEDGEYNEVKNQELQKQEADQKEVAGLKKMEDGNLFDAEYYAATYPDVAAVGNDEAALYNHYVNYGVNEGRTPYAVGPKAMADGNLFDATYYATTYPDVEEALGVDEAALYNHYVNYGINEGRLPYAK